ncbi:MAG TPA: UDP-3-O-(3-hydroxymyristoyl)glucosamine N-acyltransferase [Gammaproteobacteria bacterium]
MSRTLAELAELAGAQRRGPADLVVRGVATLSAAGANDISFLANPKYRDQLKRSRAGAVILSEDDAAGWPGAALVTSNPYLVFARVAACFSPAGSVAPGIHPGAVVEDGALVSESATIAAGAWIGRGARIGEGVYVGPNCTLEAGARVGGGTRLVANVVLGRDVTLGRRCLLHPGVVIGADGFGQARDGERWEKVPQLGSVRIGDDVEIGANTTIDRGALEDTVVEDGVKLDNQIQVAHNVHIGEHTAIAGCTAIAGSTTIGRRCMIAGGVGIAGHLEIADDVTVLAMTLVTHSIREKGIYSGSHPMEDVKSWRRNSARIRQLDELARRVRQLEKRLEKGEDNE